MKAIKIIEPHTNAIIGFLDMRPPDQFSDHVNAYAQFDRPFTVTRLSPPEDPVVIIPTPQSYLDAIQAMNNAQTAVREAIQLQYEAIVARAATPTEATAREVLLDDSLKPNFPTDARLLALPPEDIALITAYRGSLIEYLVTSPMMTIQAKNNTLRNVDFGLFYGMPSQQPYEIDFSIVT